jgi:magnesium-transporting ATPase (P-type)
MQTLRSISISDGKAAMALPLFAVISVSMIKDAFEDYKRHKSDDKENNDTAQVWDAKANSFKKVQWRSIRVGQVVKIECDQFAPCDILLLKSSDTKDICYVETKNLDGETNLKIKTIQKDLAYTFHSTEEINRLDGHILCERPNNAIYKFEGAMNIRQSRDKLSLSADNMILRGMSLRNTEEVYGIAVFTGHDTKIMRNSANAKYKFSRLEIFMNKALLIVFCLQFVFAIVASIIGTRWILYNTTDSTEAQCKNLDHSKPVPDECANAFYLGFPDTPIPTTGLFF